MKCKAGAVALAVAVIALSAGSALAATNGRIVYGCGSGICSVNPDGTAPTPVAATGSEPSCSPAGTVIIYEGSGGIWEMKADGSNQHLLVSGGAIPSISWSGTEFAYTTGNDGPDLWSLSTGFESAIYHGGGVLYPQISPSGSQFLWGNGTFQTANRDGSNVQTVKTGTLRVYYPAFTPTGQVLAVGNDNQIHRLNIDGSGLVTLTSISDTPNGVASSPDGNFLVYAANDGLFVLPANGGQPRRIVLGAFSTPSWCGAQPPHTLSVSLAGSGTVSGSGISCPGSCTNRYPIGTTVTLTASPAAGSSFAGWSGSGAGCSGTGSCSITMDSDQAVTATFVSSPGGSSPSGSSPGGSSGTKPVRCVVPLLRGKTLAAATRALQRAHCNLGRVKRPKHHRRTFHVASQSPRAGKRLAAHAAVAVTLK